MDKENLILKVLNMLLENKETSINWVTAIDKSEINEEQTESIYIWKYVILRCRNAGVHFWKLTYAKNWVYRLQESRRLYYWRVKNNQWISLSDLAINWLDDNNKTCAMISEIEITEREWAEIIPVTQWVEDTFKNAKVYIPN